MLTLPTRKEKLDALSSMLIRRQIDAGLNPLADVILTARSKSYERHLSRKNVRIEDYDTVYELAIQIYNTQIEPKPFGIDHLLRAVDNLNQDKVGSERFIPYPKIERKNCLECKDTSLKYNDNGKIDYEIKEGKKVAKRCTSCYANENENENKNKEITS